MMGMRLGVALFTAILASGSPAGAQQAKNSSPFGIAYAAFLPPASMTAEHVAGTFKEASELGAKSLRWTMPWQAIESRNGTLNWSVLDRIVQAAEASKIELVFGLTGYSPGSCCTNYANLYPAGAEEKIRGYERFLRELVRRYKGKVRYWQIENEVSLPLSWGGPLEDYISVLSAAYRTIKSEDPDSTVLMAGLAGVGDPAKERFLIERGRGHFDVLDAHLYFAPEELLGKINNLRTEMKALGYDRPIWVTETGGPHPCRVRGTREPPPEFQSSEVVKRYVELLAAGVERVFWFGLERATALPVWGCGGGPLVSFDFMMLRRGQERRPAFSTYQLMARKLEGFTAVERLKIGENISAFRFSVGSGSVAVLWADKDRVANLPGSGAGVVLTGVSGATRRVDAKAIPLNTSPVFVEEAR